MKAILATLSLVAAMAYAGTTHAEPVDRFPWDWGTECPFPWSEVDGAYQVISMWTVKAHDGKMLRLVSGMKSHTQHYLRVYQYSRRGKLEAQGVAMATKQDRIITASMRPVESRGLPSRIMIRAYLEDFHSEVKGSSASCDQQRKVMTVTFCSNYSLNCTVDQNYVLLKMKEDWN